MARDLSHSGLVERFAHAGQVPDALELIEPAFRYAKVKLTDNCNSKCITCDYWKTHHEHELTIEEFHAVLTQLRGFGIEEVMFTGGEPTMRAELVPVVQQAASLGFGVIGMTTNALSLPEAKLDQLLAAGLNQIVLSLEGLDTHDGIRGVPGNAKKVLAVLNQLSSRRATGASVSVKLAMTLMERTLDQIDGMLDLARRHQASLFLNLIDRGTYFFEAVPTDLLNMADQHKLDQAIDRLIGLKAQEPSRIANTMSSLEYARRYFRDPKQAQIPCHLGYVGVDIDANGDVYSNCWGLPPVGNIRQMSLDSILKADRYKQRCASMFRKECPGCSCGYILNLAYHKPSADMDRDHGQDPVAASVGYAGTQS